MPSRAQLLGRAHREILRAARRIEIALRHAAREVADAADVGGALGDRDGAARVEQVEGVRGLQHLFVGRQRQLLLPSGAWPRLS